MIETSSVLGSSKIEEAKIAVNGKLEYITVLQSFGILLVVLGHSIIAGVNWGHGISWLWSAIYSFHMPLFMAISGYLYTYSGGTRNNYGGFLKKKGIRLLIPYLFWSTAAFLPKMYLSGFSNRPVNPSIISYIHTLFYPVDNTIVFYWFAPTLFIIFAFVPILFNGCAVKKRYLVLITVLVLLLALFLPVRENLFNISGAAYYLLYFWLGCILACCRRLTEHLFNSYLFFGIMLTTVIVLNMVQFRFSNIIIAIAGILMSFAFSKLYVKGNFSFLNFLKGYSYQIYLLSWFPQVFLDVTLRKILNINVYVVAILMLAGGILVPICISRVIINFVPRLKMLIGMDSKKLTV